MEEFLSRDLTSPKKVRNFLTRELGYHYEDDSIETKIVRGQIGVSYLNSISSFNTYDTNEYRNSTYHSEDQRWKLRQQIVDELLTQQRLENDDNILLGVGGACPSCGIRNERKAYLIIGLPASGKSKVANNISDSVGGIIVDSDFAKRKLPEFSQYEYGATLVHKESTKIISGFDEKPMRYTNIESLNEKAIIQGANIILAKIGHSLTDLMKLSETYKKLNYEIHLVLVNLNRRKATIRAIKRYIDTGRYIPLDLIYDEYSNDPILNYYQLKSHLPNSFDSFGMITTNVDYNDPYRCIESINNSPAQLWPQIGFLESY
jgi:adenylate kinase family enzyme